MASFVAYFRVSTRAQGRSGLGLEAQSAAVEAFVRTRGGTIAARFTEVESGRIETRPELASAIAACRRDGSTLVIAKLDRLARNVFVVAQLMRSGVEFVAADMPEANKFTVHMMSAIAEYERDMISARTKAALQAARARGTRLGNPDIVALSSKGAAASAAKANARAVELSDRMGRYARRGAKSLRQFASMLNADGIPTPRGKRWTAAGVRNLMARTTDGASR